VHELGRHERTLTEGHQLSHGPAIPCDDEGTPAVEGPQDPWRPNPCPRTANDDVRYRSGGSARADVRGGWVLFNQIRDARLPLVGPPAGHGPHEQPNGSDIHGRGSRPHPLNDEQKPASAENWDTTGHRHASSSE
jgi:hypothetical protein